MFHTSNRTWITKTSFILYPWIRGVGWRPYFCLVSDNDHKINPSVAMLHFYMASMSSNGLWTLIRAGCRSVSSQPLQRLSSGWQVSSLGRVRNSKGVITRGYLHPSGYRYVGISGQNWPVHRVEMIAFHGLPRDKDAWQVNHRDGNKSNNCLDNLEYASPSHNISHSYASLQRRTSGLAQSKPVLWRVVGATGWQTFPSVTLASQQLGVSRSKLSEHCRNKSLVKGIEVQFHDERQTALLGEEWRPMLDPASGVEVSGRIVSSLGRVMSARGVISKGCLSETGYYSTFVCLNSGARRHVLVHRLVAIAFLGPPPLENHTVVNHKDLDKGNNAVNNLEWTTPSKNQTHFLANSSRKCRSDGKPVWSRVYGGCGKWTWHPSMNSAQTALGVQKGSISQCVLGRKKQAGGYEFCLAEPGEKSFEVGEEWRDVDVSALLRDRSARNQ